MGQLPCFFFHTWLVLGPSPRCAHNFLLDGSHRRGLWVHVHTYYGVVPLPFWPPRSPPAHVQSGKFPLTSGVGILSLYFNRAQLLPLALSLGVSGWEQSFSVTPLDKHQLSSPGAHLSPASILETKIWTLGMLVATGIQALLVDKTRKYNVYYPLSIQVSINALVCNHLYIH